MTQTLIVYSTITGNTAKMAQHIGNGVRSAGGTPILRAIPSVSYDTKPQKADIPEDGPPYVELQDVADCDGLIIGSPTHFGNVSAATAYFFEQISPLWISGELTNKPAGVFTSTGSMHGGHEHVLHQLMIPLMHFGMIIAGVPYTGTAVNDTTTGGTPYGPSHLSRLHGQSRDLDQNEISICQALGARVSSVAKQLKQGVS